jgi:hypothetical protein
VSRSTPADPQDPQGPDPQEVTVNESTSHGREPGQPSGAPDDAEDLLARLRSADPASSSAPDVAGLRAAVRARLADGADGAAGAVDGRAPGLVVSEEDVDVVDGRGRAVPVDELAQRRRRTGWPLRVAAVAAGALVVGGGGGYAIGAAGGGGQDATSDPAIVVADPGSGAADGGAMTDMALPEGADMMARGGEDMAMSWPGWGWGWRTVFTSSGLSADGGTARAWAFDPATAFDAATASSAAAALGVSGEPRQDGMAWTVGPTDGTAASLQVYGDGTATLSYYDPTKDSWFCATPGAVDGGGADGSVSDSGVPEDEAAEGDADASVERSPEETVVEPLPEPVDPCRERDLGPAVQGEDAVAALREVLGALGEDPGSYDVVAEDGGDERWSYVTAHQVVDGQRTGLTWGASFTGAGLQSLNGSLADLVDLGEYDVVSPQEAVGRLGDPRFGSGGGPVAWREGAGPGDLGMTAVPEGAGELPRPPAAGSAVPWPVTEVVIAEARLGVAMHTQPDGAALLLPTYELTGTDGSIWSVLAVAERHLDTAAVR